MLWQFYFFQHFVAVQIFTISIISIPLGQCSVQELQVTHFQQALSTLKSSHVLSEILRIIWRGLKYET